MLKSFSTTPTSLNCELKIEEYTVNFDILDFQMFLYASYNYRISIKTKQREV